MFLYILLGYIRHPKDRLIAIDDDDDDDDNDDDDNGDGECFIACLTRNLSKQKRTSSFLFSEADKGFDARAKLIIVCSLTLLILLC